jgi:HTH-type transcriptional regulator/antitoxin HigA
MHEIGHIDLHLRNNKEKSFMDLTRKNKKDQYETEADAFAQEKLIPENLWNNIVTNHLPLNDDKIFTIANQNKINPAILLGRVCFEMNYYAVKTKIDKSLN